MLFNSFVFILLFLPATAVLYYALARTQYVRFSVHFLVLASLFYYAYWRPVFLFLIVGSVVVNYFLARVILSQRRGGSQLAKIILIFGVGANLATIAYFKYTNFFADVVADVTGVGLDPSRKSGGALHRLHCFCLEFDGACEVQRRVPTDWIIEPIDVSGYGSFSLAS